jgi:glutamine cyclotransferase
MKPSIKKIGILILMFAAACNNTDVVTDEGSANSNPPPPIISYTVINSYPHDTSSFTEGLLIHEGQLYESTGSPEGTPHNGSWLGKIDLATGKPINKVKLDKIYFGEGISILNGRIYQLTYTTQKGFVYDAATFKKLKEFDYNGQGWSLTNDGKNLIMSDGTSNLRYLDPETLKVLKIVGVTDNNGPVANVNELEYIRGFIYANIWLTNYIIKIDPASGKVVAKLDLSTLKNEVKSKFDGAEELNGIAYDAKTDKIYVTGKLWPNLYEVRF